MAPKHYFNNEPESSDSANDYSSNEDQEDRQPNGNTKSTTAGSSMHASPKQDQQPPMRAQSQGLPSQPHPESQREEPFDYSRPESTTVSKIVDGRIVRSIQKVQELYTKQVIEPKIPVNPPAPVDNKLEMLKCQEKYQQNQFEAVKKQINETMKQKAHEKLKEEEKEFQQQKYLKQIEALGQMPRVG